MNIDDVSLLSRLRLSGEEKELFAVQLNKIIEYTDKLNEIDTSGVEPTAHILPMNNVFREDKLRGSLPPDKALSNAPRREGVFYRVPKIIE
jgi:aspartyl-tRNA(Asn)/glutamyl-tRNA(Gln) amidotransferase subunit C